MKKGEKNGSVVRTISTRSTPTLAVQGTSSLRRSKKKPVIPASGTRKSERLTPSPSLGVKKSDTMEKKNTPSPLQKSGKGKNVVASRDGVASVKIEKSEEKEKDKVEELTSKSKVSYEMTRPGYMGMFRKTVKKNVGAPANDEELVVVGCSRRVPADNDDALDGIEDNSVLNTLPVGDTSLDKGVDSPMKSVEDTERMVLDASPVVGIVDGNVIGSPETQKLPVSNCSLEKAADSTMKSVEDTEKMVYDASPMVETGDDNVIGTSETQKLPVSLETVVDLPSKRKRDFLDVCDTVANADDCVMSSDGAIPSPSGSRNNSQPETCCRCGKRQRVDGDFGNLSVCSCFPQPVQESDYMTQDMEETGPATSKDCGENRQNIQQEKSYDPKLSSIYPEYWVPVQLSNVQLELYCRTLFAKSLSLSSQSKDLVGALEETLTSVRKTCDHPYVMDLSLKQPLPKDLVLHEYVDVEVKASGKLHLLDAMLTQIKMNGYKAVVVYQATQTPGGLLLGNILDDFMSHRFGQKSYEHGVCSAKKNAINNFNKESECFVLLLESRACTGSIKLLQAEAFILFGSSLNPSQDAKFLEKIKIESCSERTKIFRLYSVFTVEEKALILARQNKRQNKAALELTRPLIHSLLTWGASYLFDKLVHVHGSETPDSGVPFEQSIMESVVHEFSSVISSKVGKENEGKLCLLLEVKYAQGTYSTDSTLFGEKHVKLSDEDSPSLFWTKLSEGKNPMWKYCSGTPQRCRKRVRYFPDSKQTAETGNDENMKKRKKASADVTDPPADNNERQASEKDHMGSLESPKVIQTSCSAASDSLDSPIARIPEDMLAGNDWRKKQCKSQQSLHAVLKRDMAELGKILHLSEDLTNMVEKILEYVIENYRVCEEPATILQAFLIALSWIAASLLKQNLHRKESLVRAHAELAFNCSREEANFIYSILNCMKSLFPKCTPKGTMHEDKNNVKSMCSSGNEVCMTEKRGSQYSLATKDVETTIIDIKRICKKQERKLAQKLKEKKVELVNKSTEKKQAVEKTKLVQAAVLRVSCAGTSTQSLVDELRQLDRDCEKQIDETSSKTDKCLKDLEQKYEAEKKKLAGYEACWINRIENWAQAELINCLPMKSGNNKQFSGMSSSNPSKNGSDVHTYNGANSEAAYDDTNCMVSKGNQVSKAANTLGTMKCGSTQLVPDEGVPSRELQISQSTSPALNRNEALVTIEDNRASQDKIFDQQDEEACSLDKEIPDELALAMPLPASVVETRGSTQSDQDDRNVCPLPSSPCGKQPGPTANIQGQNTEVAIEPQSARSETVETGAFAASEQGDQAACPPPSTPAGDQLESMENIENRTIRTSAEPHIAVPDAVDIGDSAVSDQEAMGAQDAGSLRSSLVGTQPGPEANMEEQNITTVAQLKEGTSAEDASSLVGSQPDLTANTEGQNNTTVSPLPAGSEAVETGDSPLSDQSAQDASPLPFSSLGNHPDAAVNTESLNDATIAEPHATESEVFEMEMAEPVPQIQLPTLANNLVHIAREVSVEPPAGVTASIPSLLNNGMGQGPVQHVPHVPFPVFNDPFQYELEKLRRESENIKKTIQDKKFVLKDEHERKIAELRAEYDKSFHELDTELKTKTMENDKKRSLVVVNKLLANAFLSKCADKSASSSAAAPRSRIQLLARRAAQLNALRNLVAPAPTRAPSPTMAPPLASLQPQTPSFLSPVPRQSSLPRNSTLCPMPQPRQPLISNTAPSPSVTPTANSVVNARLRSPAPHLNVYRSPSSIPTATTTPTPLSVPQALSLANVLIEQQQQQQQLQQQQQQLQQQQNSGSGMRGGSNVVCLSDDE